MAKNFYVLPKVISLALMADGVNVLGVTENEVKFVIQPDAVYGEAIGTGLLHLWCIFNENTFHSYTRYQSLTTLIKGCKDAKRHFENVNCPPTGWRKEI